MTHEIDTPLEQRLLQLLQRLDIRQVHFACGGSSDWYGLAASHPELFASLTLVLPEVPNSSRLNGLGSKLLVFNKDQGSYAQKMEEAVGRFRGATLVPLTDHVPWSDVVNKHAAEIGPAMMRFLARASEEEVDGITAVEEYGEVAGITYHMRGSGPPLVLFPLGLNPSQWEPLIPRLSEDYCTIVLGGAKLGITALLEERGGGAGFQGMVRNLLAEAELQAGESVLEVGCGTGVLDRWLARYSKGENGIMCVDFNAYLLREAAALARLEGLEEKIEFQNGDAEALPFDDDQFDVTFSVTVMEEGDARQMLAEMVRVTRPGGRVGVIVRALDIPLMINLPLRAELKAKIEEQSDWAPGVVELGCADASLYRLFNEAGLSKVKRFPQIAAFDSSVLREFLQSAVRPILGEEEAEEWRAARVQAEEEGTFFYSWPHHCAVGTKVRWED